MNDGTIWLSGELVGADVYTREGDRVGTVDDIQIDLEAGHIAFFVLRPDTGAGKPAAKRVVLPWHVLRFEGRAITARLDRQRLLEATEPDRMPRAPVDNWRQEVFEYGSPRGLRRPSPALKAQDLEEKPAGTVRMLRDVLGAELRNSAGQGVGRLDEVAVDVGTGHVACAGVAYGGLFPLTRRFYAAPWRLLGPAEGRDLRLRMERDQVELAPSFRIEDVRRRPWLEELHAHFGTLPYWEVRDPVGARRS